MTEEQIFSLLDMSETETYAILHENEITSFDQDNSLADLGVRLRGEVSKKTYIKATEKVLNQEDHWRPEYTCRKLRYSDGLFLTPTEMITAALLAGLEK